MKKYISKLICAVLSLGLTLFAATQAKADVIDWFDVNGISYEIATDYAGAMSLPCTALTPPKSLFRNASPILIPETPTL